MNKTKEAAIARSERLVATQRLITSEPVKIEVVKPKLARRAKRHYMVPPLDIEASLANA